MLVLELLGSVASLDGIPDAPDPSVGPVEQGDVRVDIWGFSALLPVPQVVAYTLTLY